MMLLRNSLFLFLLPSIMWALTSAQEDVLRYVNSQAKQHTPYSLTLTAMCGTETLWGKLSLVGDLDKPVRRASFGIMQITPRTARWIINRDIRLIDLRELNDAELIVLLLTDIDRSVQIAAYILNHHIKRHGYQGGVRKYNGIHNPEYFITTMKHKRTVRSVLAKG